MAAETLDRDDICKHFRGTCLLFNAAPYEYSRNDLETICHDVHSKGIGRERVVWEMYSSSSGLSCFTVLLPLRAKSKGRITKDSERDYCDSQGTGEDILMSDESQNTSSSSYNNCVSSSPKVHTTAHQQRQHSAVPRSLAIRRIVDSRPLDRELNDKHRSSAVFCSSQPFVVHSSVKQVPRHSEKGLTSGSIIGRVPDQTSSCPVLSPSPCVCRSCSDHGVVSDMTPTSSDASTYKTLSSTDGSDTTDLRYCSMNFPSSQMNSLDIENPSLSVDSSTLLGEVCQHDGACIRSENFHDSSKLSCSTQLNPPCIGGNCCLTSRRNCHMCACDFPKPGNPMDSFCDSSHLIDSILSQSFIHSMFQSSPKPKEKKWNIITLGLRLDKVKKKVCPCYKVYSVGPSGWLPAGVTVGKHKGRTNRITVREVINEYLRELEKFGKYKKIGRNCSDFAAAFINLMSYSNEDKGKVSGLGVMCEACHRGLWKCCC